MDLHHYVKERIKGPQKYYLIFDEIQNLINFEKVINSFRSILNCSIFISGSNEKLLSGDLASHLSGPYVSFRIMPFSLKELCQVKKIERNKERNKVSKVDFFDYLNYGGMPQRFLMGSEVETKVYLLTDKNVISREFGAFNAINDHYP
jgi:hypothetical protein